MSNYPPPPPGSGPGYPPPPPGTPPGYGQYPAPPPGYGAAPYPPPPTRPAPANTMALAAGIAVIAVSAVYVMIALSTNTEVRGSRSEAKLAGKVIYLLALLGVVGVIDGVQMIRGKVGAAIGAGILHVLLGAALVFLATILDKPNHFPVRFDTALQTLNMLGIASIAVGVLSFVAIPNIKAFGRWKANPY